MTRPSEDRVAAVDSILHAAITQKLAAHGYHGTVGTFGLIATVTETTCEALDEHVVCLPSENCDPQLQEHLLRRAVSTLNQNVPGQRRGTDN